MNIFQKISLDFGRDTLPITIFAKQNDVKTRFLEITPLNCGQKYTLDEDITPRLQLTKADGHTVINDAEVKDGVIIAELTYQALAAPGIAVAEIGLYKNDELLSSQNFYINVEKAAFDRDAAESSDEFNAFVNALGKIESSTIAAEEAVKTAEKATSAAAEVIEDANAAAGEAYEAAASTLLIGSKASRINISAEQTPTGATITVTNKEGKETTVHIDTLTAINNWNDIKNAVRLGLGEKLFPVGYEFTTKNPDTGASTVWVVRAHNHHIAANKKLTNTMTLEMKYLYSGSSGAFKGIQADAREALYYAETELEAGTYNFTWNYTSGSMISGTYQFTLTKAVPQGGQIVINTNSRSVPLVDCKITTHSSPAEATTIESDVSITEGSEGVSLGTTGDTNLNHAHRIIWGSNNYAQSAIRQWLNSKNEAGFVWAPTNGFDRAPLWVDSLNGFMSELPADFLEVVQAAVVPCRTNAVYEVNSFDGSEFNPNETYNLSDKFFLLSRPEMYGSWDSENYKDGELLEYYDGLTDTERIKYDFINTARDTWLRSPMPSYSSHYRYVHTSGSFSREGASYSRGVAPACIIA